MSIPTRSGRFLSEDWQPKQEGGISKMMGMGQVKNWLVVEPNPSERYEFASWDHDIPNMMGKSWNSMVPVTTNQEKKKHTLFLFQTSKKSTNLQGTSWVHGSRSRTYTIVIIVSLMYHTMWGPRSIAKSAKLVHITPISLYGLWYANNEL